MTEPVRIADLERGRDRCCDQDYGGSHYHCGRCGEVASMMGHYVMLDRMGDSWEKALAEKLGVTRPWRGFTCDPQNEREQPTPEMPKMTPNIDHLIRQRYVELGFSDELIEEIEAFTKAKAKELRALRNDGEAAT